MFWLNLVLVIAVAEANRVCPADFNPGIVICQHNFITEACRTDYICANIGIDQWETNGIMLLNLGVAVAPPPGPPEQTSSRFLYSDDQDGLVRVDVAGLRATSRWESSEPLVVDMDEIVPQTGVSVLFNVYNRTLWFFGPVPPEVEAHIKPLGCVRRGHNFEWRGHAIDTRPTGNVAGCYRGGRLCATPPLTDPDRYDLGFFVNQTDMCFYEPNNEEIDHLSEGVALAILMLYLCLWIGWTESTWPIAFGEDDSAIWETMYKFLPVNVDAVTFLYSLQLLSAVRRSHSLYSFEALRVFGIDTIETAISFFSYGFNSVVALGVLLVHLHVLAFHPQPRVAVGGSVSVGGGNVIHINDLWFTWGSERIATLGSNARTAIFGGALLVASGLSFFFWYVAIENTTAAILVTIYVVVVVVAWSNYPRFGQKLRQLYSVIDTVPALSPLKRQAQLLWLRTATEQLVFQCIVQSIPFDVVGTLALEYHNGIVLAIGISQLVVCGRDYALLTWKLLQIGGHAAWFLLLLQGYAGCVITYSIVFSVVSLFATAQGTRNRDGSALLLSISLALFVFSAAVAITVERIRWRQTK